MTTPDTITLGSRVFEKSNSSGTIWTCEDEEATWILSRAGQYWECARLVFGTSRRMTGGHGSPALAYRSLLSAMAEDHEKQARELREEAERV